MLFPWNILSSLAVAAVPLGMLELAEAEAVLVDTLLTLRTF
jgi:hypothetical protein